MSDTNGHDTIVVLGILLLIFTAPFITGFSYLHIQSSTTEKTTYIYTEEVTQNVEPKNHTELSTLSSESQALFKKSLSQEGTIGGYKVKETPSNSTITELRQIQSTIRYQDNYYTVSVGKSDYNELIDIVFETMIVVISTVFASILGLHKFVSQKKSGTENSSDESDSEL